MREVARAVEALLDGRQMHAVDPGESVPYLRVVAPGDPLPAAGAPVYDTTPDERPQIYAVYYLTSPARGRERMNAAAPLGLWTLTTLCVGTTPNECKWVAEAIHAALELGRLDLPERQLTPITLGTPGQVRPDDDVNPPAVVLTDVWRFRLTK